VKRVYLDHNATSPLRPAVRARLLELLDQDFGNPSSLHEGGRRARQCIDDARARCAAALGVAEDELVFTSGGTESDQLALLGALASRGSGGLACSAIEHAAVLGAAGRWRATGRELELLPVDSEGLLELAALRACLEQRTPALLSVQCANSEIGSAQDMGALAAEVERLPPDRRPLVHTDAVQALGRLPLELRAWGLDLASFSAHKLGGPLGVGLLYRRRGLRFETPAGGGSQELGLRSGTEHAAAIGATALALELAVGELREIRARNGALCAELAAEVLRALPGARVLGPALGSERRLCNTLCVLVPNSDGKMLVMRLDLEGLAASAGSACASGSLEPSHVLLALGLDAADARRGLRLSLGWNSTREDCKRAVEILGRCFGSSHATRGTRVEL